MPIRKYGYDRKKKIFQHIFVFTLSLPIKIKTFIYDKKIFNKDILKLQAKLTRDIYAFLMDNSSYLNSFEKIIIYYDNGQNLITKTINGSFAISGLNYEFKKEVQPGSYRLFQVADFVSTIRLLELKLSNSELSNSENKFIDKKHLKNQYIKGINKKLF